MSNIVFSKECRPDKNHGGFTMDKVALGQGFSASACGASLSVLLHQCSILFIYLPLTPPSFSEKGQEMKSKHCRQKNLLRNMIMHYAFNNATEFVSLHM